MPQVFFNTDTFTPDSFPAFSGKLLCDLSLWACREHPELARKLSRKTDMHLVPGFMEALRDRFDGWHLHHVAGEAFPMESLRREGLYDGRPWWELRFMKYDDHRAIHGDPDNFYSGYYGL